MKKHLSRRRFLKGTAAALTGAAVGGMLTGTARAEDLTGVGVLPEARPVPKPTPVGLIFQQKANLPEPAGTRAVVVGGGWGGLAMAKYLKKNDPELDVVLVESHAVFMSCPMSNLWLADLLPYEALIHSYVEAARNNNYIFFNATVIDVDRAKRIVYTEQGYLAYDFLVLAPGIDYDYAAIGLPEPADQVYIQTHYPAAFKPGSEHLVLKHKIDKFEKGVFVLTVPSGNYRCPPAPYERACMIAAVFKRRKIKGKVFLLDFNPRIKIKREGFQAAFQQLYADYLEYHPSVEIHTVDLARKRIIGDIDDFDFDDASIYPRVRAHHLIEQLGLANPQSTEKEAYIDYFHNNVIGDERVYVIGDSRPMPYSKSGSTAIAEAKFVAGVIIGRIKDEKVAWESPYTSCYSMVNANPPEAIFFGSRYLPPMTDITPFAQEKAIQREISRGTAFAWKEERMDRSAEMAQAMFAWGTVHWSELFD